ncbi:MAG: hypothetical protein RMX96_19865 [Nostoc sp. ChiSLP02]|nr:hypothetical protein [Nostoc sp. ChiSLP02]
MSNWLEKYSALLCAHLSVTLRLKKLRTYAKRYKELTIEQIDSHIGIISHCHVYGV